MVPSCAPGRIYFHGLGKDCLQGFFQKPMVRSI